MGTQTRLALQRAVKRRSADVRDRDTLTTCLVCDGKDPEVQELPDGTYCKVRCRWCQGRGVLDQEMIRILARAARIMATGCGRRRDPK
jgi:hypothetical protein